jgi:hypothetical protein
MNLMLACTWAGHSKTAEEAVTALASMLWAAKQQKEVQRQAYLKMIQETDRSGLDAVLQGNLQPRGLIDPARKAAPDDSVTGLER